MKSKDGFDKEAYLADVSASIVNEVFGIVAGEAESHGNQFAADLSGSIMRNFVYVLVYNSLTNVNLPADASPEEAEAIVRKSFAEIKDKVQNAVADAFEGASHKYSGQTLGYYCRILTAGPPVNSMPI